MIVVDGKNYYTFSEAAEETGYTEKTIRTYVSKSMVEGEKLPDGFVLTELGMKQLRIRKSRENNIVKSLVTHQIESPDLSQPEPENIELPVALEQKIERAIHFRTPETLKLYILIEALAKIKQKTPQQYCIEVLSRSIAGKESLIAELEEIDRKKVELMEQL